MADGSMLQSVLGPGAAGHGEGIGSQGTPSYRGHRQGHRNLACNYTVTSIEYVACNLQFCSEEDIPPHTFFCHDQWLILHN